MQEDHQFSSTGPYPLHACSHHRSIQRGGAGIRGLFCNRVIRLVDIGTSSRTERTMTQPNRALTKSLPNIPPAAALMPNPVRPPTSLPDKNARGTGSCTVAHRGDGASPVMYEWIKALHIIAVICWMAGMQSLPSSLPLHHHAAIVLPTKPAEWQTARSGKERQSQSICRLVLMSKSRARSRPAVE